MAWSFPFIGAGEAEYFEFAELHVWFERVPSAREKKAIVKSVPSPVDDVRWRKQHLWISSEARVQCDIGSAYGDYSGPRSRSYIAQEAARRRFDAALEQWLRDAHAVVPITVAYRRQDPEAGGTVLSDWHDWSVAQARSFLPAFTDALVAKRSSPAQKLGGRLILDVFVSDPDADLTEAERVFVAPELQRQRLERVRDALNGIGGSDNEGYREALVTSSEHLRDGEDFTDALVSLTSHVVEWGHPVEGDLAVLLVAIGQRLRTSGFATPSRHHGAYLYAVLQAAVVLENTELAAFATATIRERGHGLSLLAWSRITSCGPGEPVTALAFEMQPPSASDWYAHACKQSDPAVALEAYENAMQLADPPWQAVNNGIAVLLAVHPKTVPAALAKRWLRRGQAVTEAACAHNVACLLVRLGDLDGGAAALCDALERGADPRPIADDEELGAILSRSDVQAALRR